jgi:hypothetical protein
MRRARGRMVKVNLDVDRSLLPVLRRWQRWSSCLAPSDVGRARRLRLVAAHSVESVGGAASGSAATSVPGLRGSSSGRCGSLPSGYRERCAAGRSRDVAGVRREVGAYGSEQADHVPSGWLRYPLDRVESELAAVHVDAVHAERSGRDAGILGHCVEHEHGVDGAVLVPGHVERQTGQSLAAGVRANPFAGERRGVRVDGAATEREAADSEHQHLDWLHDVIVCDTARPRGQVRLIIDKESN